MQTPTCRLCEGKHWSYEPHTLAGVTPRPMIQALHTKPVTTIPKPRTETAHTCICGKGLIKPERGPMPSFCSNACRMRAKRAK